MTKIKELEKKLEKMTQDRDESIQMYRMFLESSIRRGKALDVLMPTVKTESLNEALAELYDLREEVSRLKENGKMLLWLKDNPGKGICDYVDSLSTSNKQKETK